MNLLALAGRTIGRKLLTVGAFAVPLALGILAGTVATAAVKGQGNVFTGVIEVWDNLTGQYVDIQCGAPVIPDTYQRLTLPPSTAAAPFLMVQLPGTGVVGKLAKLDGMTLFADPGGNGKATLLTGDDPSCTVNIHELETTVVSSMGGSLPGSANENTVGQFMCVKIAANSTALKVNGTATWHLEKR